MRIDQINLTNFRNFERFYTYFHPNINIFIGNNGQGKTNLIESIFLLSVFRSFRTYQLENLIMFNHDFFKVDANIHSNNRNINLQIAITTKSKKAKVDGNDIKKTSEFVGYLNAVVFTPDDLELVKGSPNLRRKFIDIELSKISPIYVFNLSKYYKLLKEKNKYLKSKAKSISNQDLFLEVLNEQMAKLQVDIICKRIHFINELSKRTVKIYSQISQNDEVISFKYKCFVDCNCDNLYQLILNRLHQNFYKDIKYSLTQEGIHKDDLKIYINQKDANTYASQGQQRTIVLAMKIALLDFIKDEIGEYPILLLDDVLSELDSSRKQMLISLLNKDIQTFITTTSIEEIDKISNYKLFHIENGRLKEDL